MIALPPLPVSMPSFFSLLLLSSLACAHVSACRPNNAMCIQQLHTVWGAACSPVVASAMASSCVISTATARSRWRLLLLLPCAWDVKMPCSAAGSSILGSASKEGLGPYATAAAAVVATCEQQHNLLCSCTLLLQPSKCITHWAGYSILGRKRQGRDA